MNCLNGFCTISARLKDYENCSNNCYVKVNMPSEREKWLKFNDGQYHLKFLFMLYADRKLERIWVKCRLNKKLGHHVKKIKNKKNINTYVPSECCAHGTFAYGNSTNPLKMHHGKCYVEKFEEQVKDKVKQLFKFTKSKRRAYRMYWKESWKHQENTIPVLKSLKTPRIEK